MWTYRQSTGELLHNDSLVAQAYSGHAEGVNNPALQNIKYVGPIPQGDWTISGPPFDTESHGPYVLRLSPKSGTETFGRPGFLIHGDSVAHAGMHTASEGCIIVAHPTREQIWNSGDRDLEVVA